MIDELSVKIFADGADLDAILALAADKRIAGFTTNPTLMWKAGLTDYEEFAKRLLERITTHPISFEVFADDADEMRRQALLISSWGENVYVKIPVTTTHGESMAPLTRELSESGVKVNVTALFTTAQVELITGAVRDGAPSYLSVFAGRIADAGIDPVPIMARAVNIAADARRAELIWASPREILNVVQADQVGCHIITVTHDLLA
ncbi:MAG: transaldolase, partial [Solirubrobacteraceae bacterium]